MSARRRRGTYGDMVRSLVLVGGFAVVVLLIGSARQLLIPTGQNAQQIHVVDYSDEARAAHRLSPDAVTPTGLPAGWRATSVQLDPHGRAVDLHVGFVTPRTQYAALEETTGSEAPFVAARLGAGLTALPDVSVDGVRWQQRRTAAHELALLHRHGSATVIVTGSAGLAELRELAGSLR